MIHIHSQLLKFLIIGGSSTIINYGVFFLIFKLSPLPVSLASSIGYLSGFVFGYLFNRKWAFQPTIPKRILEIALYISVYLFSLVISIALLNILISIFNIHPLLANIFAIGISTATNFIGLRFLVFNTKTPERLSRIVPYLTQAFFIILFIKIGASFLFGSHFMIEGFIPFIDFAARTFQNPYDHFSNLPSFPFSYPSGMLFFTGLPYVIGYWLHPDTWIQSLPMQLFLLRIPLLIFDIIIYICLCILLPTKEKSVLWLYYASPILFYISFIHGQLDVIPTAFLVLSLIFLNKKNFVFSFILLGMGIATKTHLLAVFPFYIVYLYRNSWSPAKLLKYSVISGVTFIILNPYLFSNAFINAVFNNPEQIRLFSLSLPFHFQGLSLFVAPAAILLILYKFSFYKRLNFDSLLLVLGLTYTALVALVPPMPGWFYWSLPFLIFFLIKFKNAPIHVFAALNGFFILYYFTLGKSVGNLAFTALEVSLIILAVWSYKMGVETNELFQKTKGRFLLAIAGDSGVGKSTLAETLEKIIGSHQISVVNGDDIHRWERTDPHWQETTHLNPKANRIHTDYDHITALLRGESIERHTYDHSTGTFTGPFELKSNKIILHQGLMPFLLDSMRHLSHLKIYIDADESLRIKWKVGRDSASRGREEVGVHSQIEERKPDAQRFIHPQKNFADWVINYRMDERGDIFLEYLIKNSIASDLLIEELSKIETLQTDHSYHDINFQKILIRGRIGRENIYEIAYRLYPNLYDLLENTPEFEEGLKGVHQLFFLNYLSNFYRMKHATLS